ANGADGEGVGTYARGHVHRPDQLLQATGDALEQLLLHGFAVAAAQILEILYAEHQQRAEAAARLDTLQGILQALLQVTAVTQRSQTVAQVVLFQLRIVAGQQAVFLEQAIDQMGDAVGGIDAWQQLFAHGRLADEVIDPAVERLAKYIVAFPGG